MWVLCTLFAVIGDKVWLESYNLSTNAPSKKLAAKRLWLGTAPHDQSGQVMGT